MRDVKKEINVSAKKNIVYLDSAVKGSKFIIESLPTGNPKVQLIRMGICVGDLLFCSQRLPGGTIIIQKKRQEIAIGFGLAKSIGVRFVTG